jgi:hypothetical protein
VADKALFVFSAAYSGSTMLDYMLGNHDRGFSCGECYALFRPWRPHHREPDCTCGARCGRWERWMAQGEAALYRNILTHAPGLTFIVDSSKKIDWAFMQVVHNPSIEPHFIVIYKRIEAWLQSMRRRRHTGTIDEYCNNYESWLDRLPADRTFAVSYEELLQDPPGLLRRIGERCEIGYQPGMEHFWTKTHHAVFGNDGARLHLCDRGSQQFDAVASRLLLAKAGEPSEIRGHRTLIRPVERAVRLPWRWRSRRLSLITQRLHAIRVS